MTTDLTPMPSLLDDVEARFGVLAAAASRPLSLHYRNAAGRCTSRST